MKFIKKFVPVLALSLITTTFAAPNYKACNMCQMQSQSNPMINCDSACKDIGLSDLIGKPNAAPKATKPAMVNGKPAPLATASGCRACHLCRMQSGGGYNATNCIDQCNSCHLRDPFQHLENHLAGKGHGFHNNPGFGREFSQEPVPSPAKPQAPAVVQPVKGS